MLQLDAELAGLRGDRAAELEAWRGRAELAPSSGRDLYGYGWAAYRNRRPGLAVETFLRTDPERGYVRDWSPYWTFFSRANHHLGRYDEELTAAERGLAQHPDDVAMVQDVLRALVALGRVDEVQRRSAEIFSFSPRGATTPAWVVVRTGWELMAHGDTAAGRVMLENQVEWYRGRPAAEGAVPRTRYRLVYTLAALEDWDEARPLLEQLVTDVPDNIGYLGLLGVVTAGQGRHDEAGDIREKMERLDRPYLRGSNLLWAARISAMLGERAQAVRLLDEAFVRGQTFGMDLHRDPALASLRDYPPFQEFLQPKG